MSYTTRASLQEVAESVAARFLQTVVVLDDEATYNVQDAIAPEGIVEPTFDDPQRSSLAVVPQHASHSLNAKRLTDSFADKGLICSVLVPQNQEELGQEVKASSRRADIVILDWTIHGKKGEMTKRLIKEIIHSDNFEANRFRLIIVYTAEPDLSYITSDIADSLEFTPSSDTTISHRSTRIRVLSKQEIPEDELPKTVIGEFARMIVGILPLVALSGITAVRDNTYRLLGRFHRDLDPAYLSHRMLSPNPMETELQLEAALSSEFRALVEDCQVGDTAGVDTIRHWIEDFSASLPNLVATLHPHRQDDKHNLSDFVVDLVRDGVDRHKSRHGVKSQTAKMGLTTAFTSGHVDPTNADQEFAALLSLKHSYSPHPRLWLGSVVRVRDGEESPVYWLCVQPRCDSVNLEGVTSFAFLRLLDKSEKSNSSNPCVIRDGSSFETLMVSKKAGDLRCYEFEPGETRDVVAKGEQGDFKFYSTAHTFDWVCELKDEYAQRAVTELFAWNSRIGTADSEWLRLHRK